jgi:iron complex outermembrane receptor protein
VRRDHYSDFGATTNPHIGLRWAPVTDISLRASYGKSFRAPSSYEQFQENQLTTIESAGVLNPAGPGTVPVLTWGGSKILTAERARTFNLGLEYRPANLQGFSASFDYYDIRYTDRIITPIYTANFLQVPGNSGLISPVASDAAAQAIVDAITAAGGQFFDFTDNGTGLAGVRYLLDNRQQNAAELRQSGIDLNAAFTKPIGGYTWTSQINVAFIDKIDTQYSPGAPLVNQVDIFGNPTKWRARFQSSWGNATYSISGALNAIGSYVDTNAPGNPPIASWTTADLNATLNADALFQSSTWRGVSLSMILLNAFNREPPFVANLSAINTLSYDSANANPLGRVVAVAVRKKW